MNNGLWAAKAGDIPELPWDRLPNPQIQLILANVLLYICRTLCYTKDVAQDVIVLPWETEVSVQPSRLFATAFRLLSSRISTVHEIAYDKRCEARIVAIDSSRRLGLLPSRLFGF
jgi:hypothetical protein